MTKSILNAIICLIKCSARQRFCKCKTAASRRGNLPTGTTVKARLNAQTARRLRKPETQRRNTELCSVCRVYRNQKFLRRIKGNCVTWNSSSSLLTEMPIISGLRLDFQSQICYTINDSRQGGDLHAISDHAQKYAHSAGR